MRLNSTTEHELIEDRIMLLLFFLAGDHRPTQAQGGNSRPGKNSDGCLARST